MRALNLKNLSVMEAVYIDTVTHALVNNASRTRGWQEHVLEEAEHGGRLNCADEDVRDIFRCMDLGLSTRECAGYLWHKHMDEMLEDLPWSADLPY